MNESCYDGEDSAYGEDVVKVGNNVVGVVENCVD